MQCMRPSRKSLPLQMHMTVTLELQHFRMPMTFLPSLVGTTHECWNHAAHCLLTVSNLQFWGALTCCGMTFSVHTDSDPDPQVSLVPACPTCIVQAHLRMGILGTHCLELFRISARSFTKSMVGSKRTEYSKVFALRFCLVLQNCLLRHCLKVPCPGHLAPGVVSLSTVKRCYRLT